MNLKTSQKGFTIVELLIVIVVIAILAAISIVAYVGIQNNARASERQSDATSIAKAAETAFAINSEYPSTVAGFSSTNAKLPANVVPELVTTRPTTITEDKGGKAASGGTKTYTVFRCTTTGSGGIVFYYDPRSGETNPKTVRYGEGC